MDIEILGPGGDFAEELGQNISWNSCLGPPEHRGSDFAIFVYIFFRQGVDFSRDYFFVIFFILGKGVVSNLLKILFVNDSSLKNLSGIDFIACGMTLDFLVHNRLSEVGLVLLVVAIPSVSDDVDKNVLLELLSVSNCDFDAFV